MTTRAGLMIWEHELSILLCVVWRGLLKVHILNHLVGMLGSFLRRHVLQIRFLLLRWTPALFMMLVWLLGCLFSSWIIFRRGILLTFHGNHGLLLWCLFLNLFFRGLLLRIGSIWLSLGTRLLLCRFDFLFLRGRFRGLLLLWDGILWGWLLFFLLIC
jgi:hypothetical protein